MGILAILNELAATSSKNEKIAILTRNKENKDLMNVFKAAYDPTINYFIKKIPEFTPAKPGHGEDLWKGLVHLTLLSTRQKTGNDATEWLRSVLSCQEVDNAEVIVRVVSRDLKVGATDSTANKVWKGLIPEFPYMRCSLVKDAKFDKWNWKKGVFSQLKADAMFANVDNTSDGVFISSRAGSQFPMEEFAELAAEVQSTFPPEYRLNGELQVARDGYILSREEGNGILNSVLKGGKFGVGEKPVYVAWDILPLAEATPGGSIDVPYEQRFYTLSDYIGMKNPKLVQLIPTRIVYSLDEAYRHYFEIVAQGLEGTIIKSPDAIWKDGTSKEQIKLKVEFDCDLEIVGFTAGTGKNADTFGAISVKTSDGILTVDVPGRGDDMRADFHARRDELIGRIITVVSNNITTDRRTGAKSLFLPRFIELREDKFEADTFERVQEQLDSVIKPKRKSK